MTKSNQSIAAQLTSIILHPLLMSVYSICFLFVYTDFRFIFSGQFLRFLIPVILLTCIMPIIGIVFLKQTKAISDYNLNDKKERILPLLIYFFCNLFQIWLFSKSGIYNWFIALLALPAILSLISCIISYFWKISIHMIGIGGLIGAILSICYNAKGINPYPLFMSLFILAGCVGVSRLLLNKNTPAQVYLGFIIGLVIAYFTIWFAVKFQFAFI